MKPGLSDGHKGALIELHIRLTPGQVLAAYDDEGRVLLGGIIGADR